MSLTVEELIVTIFAVGLFAATTSVAIHEGSKAGAWVSAAAFFSFSLLAAWLFWRLI